MFEHDTVWNSVKTKEYVLGVVTMWDGSLPEIRKVLWQTIGSICWESLRRGECCNKSGHEIDRIRGSLVWSNTHKVSVSQRNVF